MTRKENVSISMKSSIIIVKETLVSLQCYFIILQCMTSTTVLNLWSIKRTLCSSKRQDFCHQLSIIVFFVIFTSYVLKSYMIYLGVFSHHNIALSVHCIALTIDRVHPCVHCEIDQKLWRVLGKGNLREKCHTQHIHLYRLLPFVQRKRKKCIVHVIFLIVKLSIVVWTFVIRWLYGNNSHFDCIRRDILPIKILKISTQTQMIWKRMNTWIWLIVYSLVQNNPFTGEIAVQTSIERFNIEVMDPKWEPIPYHFLLCMEKN